MPASRNESHRTRSNRTMTWVQQNAALSNAQSGRSSRLRGTGASSTNRHTELVLPTRANPHGIPYPQRRIIRGFLFASSDHEMRTATFPVEEGNALTYGGKTIPSVGVTGIFGTANDVTVYHAFIRAYDHVFLVYGFHDDQFPVNQMVKRLKKTTEWRGHVAIFCVGKRTPLLKAPCVDKVILEAVVSFFVSRITQHLDDGTDIPKILD